MIHSTAVIDPSARIDENVSIGPYSIIGANVEIGAGTWIGPHVVIQGPTKIGRNNKIYQFSSLGEVPQDKKFNETDETWLEIGDGNVIREFCTFNRGTAQDAGKTVVGNDNWIMAYVHLAHDCVIKDHTIFANGASLAGHVTIGNYVVMGGFALVYQFVTVGDYAICGFSSGVKHDVPPYSMVDGMPAKAVTINIEGLRRNYFSKEEIQSIREAFRLLYKSGLTLDEAKQELLGLAKTAPVINLLNEFFPVMKRGLIR
ncbi:acyl-ACP--UDP-N-acetylglucosamine O-acyltransferase [Ostreibacterium oceani]|uniref:Acyl-[acyl-carrier-protein]--UDP-N-acetylglucosamine O-acyltransferase n=1 Tax=Ostreibacterium oceani TaxID=2654998 RepID=A0A6N7EUJ5_9GAMM|nr:acyl-ACP--UDP-N-acetylglucosamine O-acyltransferase [Ostreibacterium oceani]